MQPSLTSLRSTIASWPQPTARILRVGQLDAELLDQELVTMLKEPMNKALGQLGVCSQPVWLAKLLGSILTEPVSQSLYTKLAMILKLP